MLDALTSTLLAIASFIVVLSIVITFHELGHYWAGRLFGVKTERFSLGFGRALISHRDKRGVEWRIGWLPLGGYVKFAGDLDGAPDAKTLDAARQQIVAAEGAGAERAYFDFKPVWQRALIVFAGPFANFVLAVLIFASLAMAAGEVVRIKPVVGEVSAGGAAAEAGFRPGDLITRANGRAIDDWSDVAQMVQFRAGEPIRFDVERAGQTLELTATPRARTLEIDGQPVTQGVLGIAFNPTPETIERRALNPVTALGEGVRMTATVLDTTLTYLRRVVTGRESGDQLSGPLGIARASGTVASGAATGAENLGDGVWRVTASLLLLTGLLSVGVGFLNLLPVPILDGGRLVFYAYEAVARRPLDARIQELGYRVGLVLLVGLILFATWNDVQKFSLFRSLGGSIS
ncbi:RIP metalloprotease [Brevundimonas sp. 2R-24]|uniref:RIP metalloprotease n=1 Tax=Peiella sedimenti TaxID=3061083 RepID=A0ABT8SPX8_9CAUL|nr:RIP metalloprotease [Caulobacteraceae bacterium XZ-24]